MNNQDNDFFLDKTYIDKNFQKRPSKSLFGVIIGDLFRHQKISLLLLVMIIISAGAV